jgi:hypothetical protein
MIKPFDGNPSSTISGTIESFSHRSGKVDQTEGCNLPLIFLGSL